MVSLFMTQGIKDAFQSKTADALSCFAMLYSFFYRQSMKGVCIGFTISEHCYWLTKFLWFFSNQSPEVLFPRLAAVAIFCSDFWLVLWVYLCFSSLIRFRWFWSITIETRDFLRISVIYCKLSQRAWFLSSHSSHVMYQAALQLNGTSRNQYNSPGKSPTTDYIEVVSWSKEPNNGNFSLKREYRWSFDPTTELNPLGSSQIHVKFDVSPGPRTLGLVFC